MLNNTTLRVLVDDDDVNIYFLYYVGVIIFGMASLMILVHLIIDYRWRYD